MKERAACVLLGRFNAPALHMFWHEISALIREENVSWGRPKRNEGLRNMRQILQLETLPRVRMSEKHIVNSQDLVCRLRINSE